MSRTAVVALTVVLLLVSFQLGRESVKMEIRDAFVRAFSSADRHMPSFRVYAEDVFRRDLNGGPWEISCPECCGYPEIKGFDKYEGRPISCPLCGLSGVADVRTMLRPVVVVAPPEPTDYARTPRRRQEANDRP